MHFGATLQLLRGHAGLSLRELAARVGVSAAYLSRVEHGHDPPPSADRVRAIAQAMGIGADALLELLDEVRPDAAGWLAASATGRRLVGALRRRRLTEAQLARVLAFVEHEFQVTDDLVGARIYDLLEPPRILMGVKLGQVEDALALLAMRLSKGAATARVLHDLSGRGDGAVSAIGCGSLVAFARGGAPSPTAALLILQAPLDFSTPDERPVRLVWALVGVGGGPKGAAILTQVAHLADDHLVDALGAATRPEEVMALLRRFEHRSHR